MIAILAILAAITIIAVNPKKQLAQARDKQRTADAYSILSAIYQYAADHDGIFPENITTESLEICQTSSPTCVDLLDVSVLSNNQEYLVSVPVDPRCSYDSAFCTANGTGYFLQKTASGRITISVPGTEVQDLISITR